MNNAKKQNSMVGKSRQDGSYLLRRRHPSQTTSLRIFTTSRTALDLFFTKVYLDQYRFSYFLGRYSVVHLYPIIIKANQVNNCLQTSPFYIFYFHYSNSMNMACRKMTLLYPFDKTRKGTEKQKQ